MSWAALGVLAAGSYLFKAAGLIGFSRVSPGPGLERLTALIPPALLSALVLVPFLGTRLTFIAFAAALAAVALVSARAGGS